MLQVVDLCVIFSSLVNKLLITGYSVVIDKDILSMAQYKYESEGSMNLILFIT